MKTTRKTESWGPSHHPHHVTVMVWFIFPALNYAQTVPVNKYRKQHHSFRRMQFSMPTGATWGPVPCAVPPKAVQPSTAHQPCPAPLPSLGQHPLHQHWPIGRSDPWLSMLSHSQQIPQPHWGDLEWVPPTGMSGQRCLQWADIPQEPVTASSPRPAVSQ